MKEPSSVEYYIPDLEIYCSTKNNSMEWKIERQQISHQVMIYTLETMASITLVYIMDDDIKKFHLQDIEINIFYLHFISYTRFVSSILLCICGAVCWMLHVPFPGRFCNTSRDD